MGRIREDGSGLGHLCHALRPCVTRLNERDIGIRVNGSSRGKLEETFGGEGQGEGDCEGKKEEEGASENEGGEGAHATHIRNGETLPS